jgi:predicted Zn-dependent protease
MLFFGMQTNVHMPFRVSTSDASNALRKPIMSNIWPGFVATHSASVSVVQESQREARRMARKLQAERRRRTVWVMGALVIGAVFGSMFSKAHSQSVPVPPTVVHVNSGDTVWSIAKRYPRSGVTTGARMHQILKANPGLSGTLYAGDTVVIPGR